ncbi:MAG: bifunctional homocysteine S-methyltransferase/methylenetetrahydrofolate reductase [Anaerolineales bacterium]|nr:bifunctional homocysteine S-methyltransferase/methylenetetrahydrofolate reductase [Anaerolineales bacterium]
MNRREFEERLQQGKPLLMDGATGTVLYSFGVSLERPLDLLNLENPKLVADVHRAYIEAGADIILTNTFGANRFKLGKHSADDRVAEINSAAVSVARRVIASAFRPVLLAGSVGPLAVTMAPLGRVSARQVRMAFMEQIGALVEPLNGVPGVDLLVLETMSNLQEVRTAVEVARSIAPHTPIVAQVTFTREDRTLLGNTATDTAVQLQQMGVDALGINCSSGPAQIYRLLRTMRQVAPDMPLAVSPNAGYPEGIEGGRVVYPATPHYFGQYVSAFVAEGAALIGGCCGTTAEHIAAMREAIDYPARFAPPVPLVEVLGGHTAVAQTEVHGVEENPDKPTHLARSLQTGVFVKSVEMTPPRGTAVEKLIASARSLSQAGAHFLNVADMPQARMRLSAWAAGYALQQAIGLETILHFPTRGRNLLRIQADLLGMHTLGLRNLFVTLGDRTKVGDYPEADDHYDIMPGGLIKLIKEQLNTGVDQLENALDQPTNFVVGCGVNLNNPANKREMRLLHENVQNGVDFALSRLIFDAEKAHAFLEAYRREYGQPPPILAAIQPLFSASTAEFIHHEVPGIEVPEKYRQAMRLGGDNPWQGVTIAQEIALQVAEFTQGVVLVPYNDRYDLAADVLEVI